VFTNGEMLAIRGTQARPNPIGIFRNRKIRATSAAATDTTVIARQPAMW